MKKRVVCSLLLLSLLTAILSGCGANKNQVPTRSHGNKTQTDSDVMQQGIEFVLAGSHTFPNDYPEIGTNICVVGEFDTYEEDGYMYCTLRNAILQ